MTQEGVASYKLLFTVLVVVGDLVLGFITDPLAVQHGLRAHGNDTRKLRRRRPAPAQRPLPSGFGPCCGSIARTYWSCPRYGT